MKFRMESVLFFCAITDAGSYARGPFAVREANFRGICTPTANMAWSGCFFSLAQGVARLFRAEHSEKSASCEPALS